MGNRIKEELATAIGDLLETLIDQRIDRRLSNTTIRLSGGVNDSGDDDDEPDDDDFGGPVRSGKKKKKRSAKKAARRAGKVGKVGKVGKKRAKRTVAASSEEAREDIHKLLLQRGPLQVTKIVKITGINQGLVNAHLNVLKKQKRAESLRDGPRVLYKATRDGRIGRKTAEKPLNGSVPPPAAVKPVVAA